MRERRPSWQSDECPPWCVGDHDELDHPDDRVHRSSSVEVPVVARRTLFEGSRLHRQAESAVFEAGVSRVDGESATWLYLGDGPNRSIEVSIESAERIAAALEAVIRNR